MKIKFTGFTEIGTGGGCTGMEFALPYKYSLLVTDEGEVPPGDECTLTLNDDEGNGYLTGACIDFSKRTIDLIEFGNDDNASVEVTLQKGGARISFRHQGHWVPVEVFINWTNKTMEVA